MNDNLNAEDSGALRKRRPDEPIDAGSESAYYSSHSSASPRNGSPSRNGVGRGPKIDLWVVLDLLGFRWPWLIVGTLAGAACFGLLGLHLLKPKFTAYAQLRRFELLGKSDFFKTTAPISSETFGGMLRSPEILKAVGSQLEPPVPPATLAKWVKIDPEPDSDMVRILGVARTPQYAANLVNLYASNAVEFIRDLDARQFAIQAQDYLKKQVTEMDEDVRGLENQFRQRPFAFDTNRLAQVGSQLGALGTNIAGGQSLSMGAFSEQAQRLQTAMAELNDLLTKYTEAHPKVQAKQEYIDSLKREMAAAGTNANSVAPIYAMPAAKAEGANPDLDILHIKMRALEDKRLELANHLREAELYATNKPASVEVFAPAEATNVKKNLRAVKVSVATIFGGLMGFGSALLLILLVEFLDSRLKTADDITRVTKLPVLGTLGNLHEMRPEDRAQWAFRTWTMLQGNLSPTPNHGLICGITSAASGEGRSTWISLLAEAASLTGFRVLTIATRPSATHLESADEFSDGLPPDGEFDQPNGHQANALTSNVLSSPAQITEQLTRPNSQPVVHIPLPGWVWNLERRKQWREAISQWGQTENLVILVELPPATVPEAVLLGSNLPNLVWLADAGSAEAAETQSHLETLRHARCKLVGAVLNREPRPSLKNRFPRWITATVMFGLASLSNVGAQENPAAAGAAADPPALAEQENSVRPQTNRSFSVVQPSQRAAWQQRLTLGPGDVVTLNLYGEPELTRTEVAIGPDGRLSYLEAQDVVATGLTIDDLRAKLDQEIGKFRRAPHTMITPVAFKSKKYFMLGKVATKGVYTLDQPLTLVEALARAHGFENALIDRNVYDLVDLTRSFIARQGRLVPINLQMLFQEGDLSQNVVIEPGDYVYFAAGDVQEVYVLGEVRLPGPVTYNSQLTVVGAIAARGGFTERAYRAKVLVVRGSLNRPERIAVDTHAVVDGKGRDFQVRPKDIIFVNSRPFIKVEELADLAATAFIQSVVTEAVGVNVVKPIQ